MWLYIGLFLFWNMCNLFSVFAVIDCDLTDEDSFLYEPQIIALNPTLAFCIAMTDPFEFPFVYNIAYFFDAFAIPYFMYLWLN